MAGGKAGFPHAGGTEQQCGHYILDLGCVSGGGKTPICSRPVVNCTFVDAQSDKNCPSLDTSFLGVALLTNESSPRDFQAVFSTLHPHDSQNPFAPSADDLKSADSMVSPFSS